MNEFYFFSKKSFLVLTLIPCSFVYAVGQNLPEEHFWWEPNSSVWDIEHNTVNNVIYLGGDFTSIGPADPVTYGAKLDSTLGIPDLNSETIK